MWPGVACCLLLLLLLLLLCLAGRHITLLALLVCVTKLGMSLLGSILKLL
jgi:hypothetical protein